MIVKQMSHIRRIFLTWGWAGLPQ